MSATTTYYLYFSMNTTQVFAKYQNDISLVNFSYEGQAITSIENSLTFDFDRKDIVLRPLVPHSTLNHHNVFDEKVVFAGYHYRLDETLEVLLLFLLSHGLTLNKKDRIAVIYGFGELYLDEHQETFDSTIQYILRRYDVVMDGYYRETHLLKMGFDLLSFYTKQVWLYLKDTMMVYDRYIAPKAYFTVNTAYGPEELDRFYQDLQKKLHYLSLSDINRIAGMLQHDYDKHVHGTAYVLKDEVFPIHHELVNQVFSFQSNGIHQAINTTIKQEKDMNDIYVIHTFQSRRLQEDILSFLKRKRSKRFLIDHRVYLIDRYLVLVTELISKFNHEYRFQLHQFLSKHPSFPFDLHNGIYYLDPQILHQFTELEKSYLQSGEFRAYQSFVEKNS